MLVLSRRKGEALIINGNVRIVIVEVIGNNVRLGCEADPSISIDREELFEAKQRRRQRDGASDFPAPPTT